MRKSLLYAVSVVLVATFSSCNSDEGKEKAYQEPNVYVAGAYENENGTSVATLWTNGVAQSLTNGVNDATALSVFVLGDDVYVAGSEHGVAKLWINGIAHELTSGTQATSVHLTSGGDVYVVGHRLLLPSTLGASPIAMLWVNGIAQELSDGIFASSVFVSDTNVYVAGCGYGDDFYFRPSVVAKLWINGVAQELVGSSEASSVFVVDSNVYVAGCKKTISRIFGVEDISTATTWKNGVAQILTDSTKHAIANAVHISNNDVFVAGYDEWVAKLWKNNVEHTLTNGTNRAAARSIYIFENDVYVAGYDGNIATLWKNGIAQNLTDGTLNAYAHSVFVK